AGSEVTVSRYRSTLRKMNVGRCLAAALLLLMLSFFSSSPAQARLRLSKEGRKGRRYLLSHRWADAAREFQLAVARARPAPAESEGLAYALLKSDQFDQAAKTYLGLCKVYPQKSPFWVNLGLAYAYQEPANLAEAEKAFRMGLRVNPRDPDALLNLAVCLHRMARFPEALPL